MKSKFLTFTRNNLLIILLAFTPPIFVAYYFQRENLELSVTILNNTDVVYVDKQFADGIKILYNNEKINSLTVVDLKIENTGNRPIERNQFDSPMEFKYNGIIPPKPEIITALPKTLNPKLNFQSPSSYKLEPLLLNEDDTFTFRANIINSVNRKNPVEVLARIVGIKSINIINDARANTTKYTAIIVISIVALVASAFSLISLLSRLREITLKVPFVELTLSELSKDDEAKMAEVLNINEQNIKSSLLLIRIKIEEQLRQLAIRINLPEQRKLRSIHNLVKILRQKDVLSPKIASDITEVLPIINRELHASESYLSTKEFKSLHSFSIELISYLEKFIQKF